MHQLGLRQEEMTHQQNLHDPIPIHSITPAIRPRITNIPASMLLLQIIIQSTQERSCF